MRAALALPLALMACTVGPDHVPPTLALAPAFRDAARIDGDAEPADWWRGFGDPLLSDLVARAVAGSPDLEIARARIGQSRAAARAAGAALLPTVEAAATATTLSQSQETAVGRVTRTLGLGRGYTEYAAGAQAGWEIDLFGGGRRRRQAARRDLDASLADAAAARVAVAAETADAYLALRALQVRLAVAERQAGNRATLVRLVRQRFDQGVAAGRELNRAVAASEEVRAAAAPLRAGVEAQLNRLDVLVGAAPGTNRALLATARPIPTAPVPAGGAAPADLLRRRPDIVAAERRVAAADARIGAALAAYYPHLSLSTLLGVAGLGTARLFTGDAVQAAASAGLRWRLFDFGRLDAEVANARSRKAEALAAWRAATLRAAEEVETSLSRLTQAHRQRRDLEKQASALVLARTQAEDGYTGGIIGLTEVTDADRDLLSAADAIAGAEGEEARAAVAAYRALGGGWHRDDATETSP